MRRRSAELGASRISRAIPATSGAHLGSGTNLGAVELPATTGVTDCPDLDVIDGAIGFPAPSGGAGIGGEGDSRRLRREPRRHLGGAAASRHDLGGGLRARLRARRTRWRPLAARWADLAPISLDMGVSAAVDGDPAPPVAPLGKGLDRRRAEAAAP